jgi:hypothetical protein
MRVLKDVMLSCCGYLKAVLCGWVNSDDEDFDGSGMMVLMMVLMTTLKCF